MYGEALVIEPNSKERRWLGQLLAAAGWQVTQVSSLAALANTAGETEWTVVFYTVTGHAASQLNDLRQGLGPQPHIIALGPASHSAQVVDLLLSGASDYLTKPLCATTLIARLPEVGPQATVAENFDASPVIQPAPAQTPPTLIGAAAVWVRVLRQVGQMLAAESRAPQTAPPLATYFLAGETGTGKELFARLIHQRSRFHQGPFVAVNCATLAADLADAELFGHEAGAYTGATKTRPGLWEQAEKGTLFLDEITEAPVSLLPKLLRVLQDGQVRRVGGTHWRTPRVQVIAASNRDLAHEIAAGRMRRDLYHRFLHHLHLPPLRERREDIPLLVAHFAQRYAPCPVQFSAEAMALLHSHHWPGNVRELEHALRAVVTQTVAGRITAATLRTHLPLNESGGGLAPTFTNPAGSWEERVQEFRLHAVRETLAAQHGNVTRTAAALGLTRAAVYKILRSLTAHAPTG